MSMAGRHSRPTEIWQASDGDIDQRLKALTTGRPVVEEGVSVPDGGDRVFLSRRVFHPDGRLHSCLVRLDSAGLFPYPPPDRPQAGEP
ncbi:hypothetical protein [Kitasatospora sp. NPDC017646]|uniref:hypothetical protein n=1 Tax=Kitasatospora sp. NPDC017646 TaxID=3364024 RepID=UPI0037B19002